jgi:hypothetical protein
MDPSGSAEQTLLEEAAMNRQPTVAAMLAMTLFAVSVGEAEEASDDRAATEPRAQLDLSVPDITELYTEEQIHAFLAATFEEHAEEVEVRGRREPVTPSVWPGIAAPVWAIFNPTQAWRIIAPLPPDRSRALAFSADITTPYQEPSARTAIDW